MLQLVLAGLLAHVGRAALQEGPHEGLGLLGSQKLHGDKVAWGPLLWWGALQTPGPPTHHRGDAFADPSVS